MEDSPGRRCTCSGDGEDGGVNNMAVVSPLPPHMLAGLAPADKALDAPLVQTRIPNMSPKTLPMSKEDEYDRVHQRLAAIRTTTGEMKKSQTVQMEYCVSPRSPLLVTAIEENGWSCGDNSSGQLGTGAPFECVPARTITEVKRWAAMSLGPRHGAGLDSNGKLYTWGLSDQGQLGLGATAQALAPTPVEDVPEMDPESDAFRGVACGAEHTVAVTTRHVLAWGSDRHGQLGLNSVGSLEPVSRPRIVMDLVGLMVTQVVCGSYHTMCATAQSVVYSWGCNTHGQLGLEDCQDRHAPVVVDALWALPVKQLAAGETHSAALTTNGALFTWGCNRHGQLGQPPDAERAAEVRRRNGSLRSRFRKRINQKHLNQMLEMGIEKEMAELALHETNNCGVDVAIEWLFSAAPDHINAKMAEWVESPDHPGPSAGANGAVVPSPRRVPLKGVRYVAAGMNHTVAVTDDGLYSWGANESGQLGLGNTADAELPAPVAALSELKVGRVACGSRHTLFLTDDGQVLGCGCTSSGQLSTLDASSLARDLDASGRVASGGRERLHSQRSRLGLSGPPAAAAGPGVGSSSSAVPWDDSEAEQQPQPRVGSEASLSGLVEGQLVLTPLPVQLPFMAGGGSGRATTIGGSFRSPAGSEPVVCDVQAGGDGSTFLVRGRDDEVGLEQLDLWERLQDTISEVEQRVAEGMMDMAKAHSLVKRLEQAIEMIFGKAAALSAAFGYHSKVGLDYLLVEETHLRILNLLPLTATMTKLFQQQVETALFKATGNLVDELASHSKLLNTAERAQLLMVVAQNPLLADHKRATQLLPKICETILTAPSAARHLLTKWWSDCPKDLLELRVVRPIQSFLTTELNTTKKLTTPVMNAIKVLSKVEESNQISQKLPPEVMYNQLISEKMDVLDHYVAWRQTQDVPEKRGSNGPFSFCSYPFLLDAKAKSKLLQTEARIQMEQTIAQARMESLYKHSAKRGTVEAVQYVLPRKKQGTGPGPNRSNLGFARRAARMAASVGSSGAGSSAGSGAGSSSSGSRGDAQRQPGLGRLIFGRLFNGARAGRDADAGGPSTSSSSGSSSHGYGIGRSRRDMRDAEDEDDKTGRASGDSTARGSQLGSEERRLMALDVSASQLLPRQNSMHLPPPDRCNTPATHSDHCILRIRRTHLLLDAMDEVARQKTKDLFKPLRVVFIGEDGIDAGGVRKEFFALLLQELLSPEYGLFLYQPESRTYWINPLNLDMDDDWTLMGLVVGLAVYNGVLLDLPLPVTFYKKMLGLKCNLRDLEEMQPDIGKSLRQLLTYEGPGLVEDIFAQTFSIEQHVLGQVLTLELVPGGDSIPVTEENRAEFVELYVEQVLVKGVARQFEAFKRGFMLLFEGPAIGLFNAQELERLVCGNPNLNFEALITHARYEGGFTAESMAVQWLWKTVRDFGMEEKKMFLKFFTGSDRAPIGGLGNLRCLIQRDGPDSHKLPTSHTCFNTLLLPDYSSLERLRDRLQLAIMNSEGFGLE